MAGTTFTVQNELLTSVTFRYIKNDAPNQKDVPGDRRLTEDAMKLGMQTVQGGERIIIGWEFEEHSVPTRVTLGSSYGQIRTSARPTMRAGWEQWAYVVQPVFIGRYEMNLNRSESKIVDITQKRVKNVRAHLFRQYQSASLMGALASGTFTGTPEWDDIVPLNGADYSNGIIEDTASGTGTIHNVPRSSYPVASYPLFHNLVADVGDSASTNLLNRAATMAAQMEIRGIQASAGFRWYCTAQFWENVSRLFRNAGGSGYGIQYASVESASNALQGRPMWMGKPLTVLSRLPSTGSGSTNDPWSCVGVGWGDGVQLQVQAGNAFDADPWYDVPGTPGARMMVFHFMGQNIMLAAQFQALFHSGETYS